MPNDEPKCIECGSTIEVLESPVQWRAWGRCFGHMAWQRIECPLYLCEECEADNWEHCECGALIESYWYRHGYLPEDYDGDTLCPECAEKQGFERTAGIGNPYDKRHSKTKQSL